MTTKQILILANSIKHYPCVCIAGREIISGKVEYQIGGWIRPVSTHGEGELSQLETILINNRQPVVMDFVEIPLSHHAKDQLQPENWVIADQPRWKRVNDLYATPSMGELVERPSGMWIEPGEKTDRISNAFLKRQPPSRSICLISVDNLRVRFEWKQWQGQSSKKHRAIFSYRGVRYDLSITDPIFIQRHREKFPAPGHPAKELELDCENGCFLCVSLTPPFGGRHYKVVATIFES